DRFRNHVLHAERLEYRAHRTTRDDAGSRRSCPEIDAARAVPAENVVMECAAFAQRNAHQIALRRVCRLADRLRNFTRLAVAVSDPALLVADDHKRSKAEATATLHHFCDAVDVHELVNKFALALFPLTAFTLSSLFTCHNRLLSSHQNLRPL